MLLLLRKQLCIVMLVCFESGMVTIMPFTWSPAEVCGTFKCLISLGEELAVDSGSIHLLLWSHEIFHLHVGMSTAVIKSVNLRFESSCLPVRCRRTDF